MGQGRASGVRSRGLSCVVGQRARAAKLHKMGDSDLKPGTKIRLDGKYSGEIRFKGPIDGALDPFTTYSPETCSCTQNHASPGRKGEWLGLEMNDTVGDNDGSVDGKSYFTTHDVRAPSHLHGCFP